MKKLYQWSLLVVLVFMCSMAAHSQQYFRIRTDVSVKTKLVSGEQSLSMGQIFYDRNEKKIVYQLTFPEKSMIITADTVTYRIVNDTIVQRTFSPALTDFSVFHLALSSHLPDFGLKRTQYTISEVNREGEMVITTWTPPEKLADDLGKILISVMDKKLYGVILYSPLGEITSKQFFEDYRKIGGLAFPGKITEISYSPEGESYQIMTFKNTVLDELQNNHMYTISVDRFR